MQPSGSAGSRGGECCFEQLAIGFLGAHEQGAGRRIGIARKGSPRAAVHLGPRLLRDQDSHAPADTDSVALGHPAQTGSHAGDQGRHGDGAAAGRHGFKASLL